MLRFNEPPQRRGPRNYLARPEQLRLLVLVASLGLVVVLMSQVRSPAGRELLARMLGTPGESSPGIAEAAADDLSETRQWMTAAERESIRDNTVFRNAEADAWFAVLGKLQNSTEPTASLPAAQVAYAQLVRQPEAYRGRTVRIDGQVMRVEPQTPAEHPLGLEEYYRVILRPAGREVWPIAVYAIEPPAVLGENLPAPGHAVGVFFKNQSYQSEAGAGIMPIVLAQKVVVRAAPQPNRAQASTIQKDDLWVIAFIAAGVATLVVWFVGTRGRGK